MTETVCCRMTVALLAMLAIAVSFGQQVAVAQSEAISISLDTEFQNDVRPLLERYCFECHTGENAEAEIDLASLSSLPEIRTRPEHWQKILEVLVSEQMPPPDSSQLDDQERKILKGWLRDWLKNEAKSQAGDPGPVILRRLSNAEYDYTIQDLTEVESLNPTAEFPVDGAAGEGFTNSGSAQGMSPALVTKFLDAAKDIARHAVLLPDGIRFSPFDSRRDHSDELVAKIQAFYRRFTDEGGGTEVDLQGIRFETNQEGLIPIDAYLRATLDFRDGNKSGRRTIQELAKEHGLSARYLDRLWRTLTDESPETDSFFLAELRNRWKPATASDIPALSGMIEKMQKSMWRFNPVGQIGRAGGPDAWMEPLSPVVPAVGLRLPLAGETGQDSVFYLSAINLDDSGKPVLVEWQRPRLEYADGRPAIMLKDIGTIASNVQAAITAETGRTAEYLAATRRLHESSDSIESVARTHDLDPKRLASWAGYLDLGPNNREISGLLTQPVKRVNGNESINGWGSPETPSLLTNQSTATVTFSTLTLPPESVFVHPSPTLNSAIVWRSPFDGIVKVNGFAADADGTCGNGIQWTIQHQNERGSSVIDRGLVDNAQRQDFAPNSEIDVRIGDLISLIVDARDRDHVCDTTQVDITLTESGGENRTWNLVNDVVHHVQDGNPVGDSYSNRDTWHFCAHLIDPESLPRIPSDSTLGQWKKAVSGSRQSNDLEPLALSVQRLLTSVTDANTSPADLELRAELLSWHGPLNWLGGVEPGTFPVKSDYGMDAKLFGATPDGTTIDVDNLCLAAPRVIEIRLPWQLVQGAVFVTDGALQTSNASGVPQFGGGVQFQVSNSKPDTLAIDWSLPFVASDGPSRDHLEHAIQQFRDLFPAALCYTRIVPVDETVTLTLYYREDNQLKRLILSEKEIAELDRLWDELYFVSQEPISLTAAFEQISEFATQDRPDLVESLAPMRKPIYDRADAFRWRLLESEPVHVEAVERFASQAWRRPLLDDELQNIRNMYQSLRDSGLPHDDAIRLVMTRVLTSPLFLYKLEQAGQGDQAVIISDLELATRLSYFLWSSLPDRELRRIAESGELLRWNSENGGTNTDSEQRMLLQQTQRMLNDARTRRLAVQFACQWLHIRDFDRNNDKNERVFPEFPALRNDMYEETVLFFEDMFRNDGSILDVIDADHTFLNESLATHYGIEGVSGSHWQRVEGIRNYGRGGVLGMSTVLASQSGASRTSPILRGNWVYETLLGERLPRPPADVPQLPENLPEGLTARQLIDLHSRAPECARCHVRIDPYGFALEQFDAIGRLRPVETDTSAQLVDGTPINGIKGVIEYLSTTRRDDVIRHFCRKLLGYALGREVLLSDEPLLDEMQIRLKQNGYRFSIAVETIVSSPQFLKIRGRLFEPPTQ